ncbi:DUF11 domain-containing protein [Paenibacillus rhizoplanae]
MYWLSKSSTVTDAVVGDTVPYSISVTNSGIAPINNVVLSDPIPAGSSFVPGSVVVDGTPLPGGESCQWYCSGHRGPGRIGPGHLQHCCQHAA